VAISRGKQQQQRLRQAAYDDDDDDDDAPPLSLSTEPTPEDSTPHPVNILHVVTRIEPREANHNQQQKRIDIISLSLSRSRKN
jgi:hypothetical protein